MFTIFVNRRGRYAAVHRSTCNRLKVHRGVSRTDPPGCEYFEYIPTVSGAASKAQSTNLEVRYCSWCNPPRPTPRKQ